MAGDLQPLDEKFPIVGEDGRPTLYFIKWAQQRQIDITGAVTADEALEIVVDHLVWGNITGILSNQTDLQTELDLRVPCYPLTVGPIAFTPAFADITGQVKVDQLAIRNTQGSAFFSADSGWGNFGLTNAANTGGAIFGYAGSAGRTLLLSFGAVTGFEFSAQPYVGTNKIFHEGNLLVSRPSIEGLTPASGGGTVNFLRADGTGRCPRWRRRDDHFPRHIYHYRRRRGRHHLRRLGCEDHRLFDGRRC
jgi:hypothetical protein